MLTRRYAPIARVLETRGGCEVALVSMGTDSGLEAGMPVEFFEYVDHSDIVSGAERQPSGKLILETKLPAPLEVSRARVDDFLSWLEN